MDIEAKNLNMRFDDGGEIVQLFGGLSFHIESGSSVAIIGESGVGKTTLLYLLGGLEVPTDGDVLIGGNSLKALERKTDGLSNFRGSSVGFIFQFHNLLPEFSAIENVVLPLLIAGNSRNTAEERARYLLSRVGLSHRENHRPGTLSGGEQQRVAIARALSRNPSILLADEPTGNLDHRTGGQVSELLLEVQREQGLTLVVVTHSRELAARMGKTLELKN